MGNENWDVYVNEIDLFNVCPVYWDKQIRHFLLVQVNQAVLL